MAGTSATRRDAPPPAAAGSAEVDVVTRQLSAIASFHEARRAAQASVGVAARSREGRMDAERRLAVLRREHEALVARAHEQLLSPMCSPARPVPPRAVLAHRNPWFAGKVGEVLRDNGVTVVACIDNGADAVGLAIAEQPDLALVEDCLAMVSGEEVVRSLRQFCPATVVAAQVGYSDRVGALLEAGAQRVFVRRVPPGDVARELRDLFRA